MAAERPLRGGLQPDRSLSASVSGVVSRDIEPLAALRRLARHESLVAALNESGMRELRSLAKARFRARGQDRDTLPQIFALAAHRLRACHGLEVGGAEFRLAALLAVGSVVAEPSLVRRRAALAMAAAAGSLAGEPQHVLCGAPGAAADMHAFLEPVLQPLGIGVSRITADDALAVRRRAYRTDVVVTTPRELALDYLRDRVQWPNRPGGLAEQLDRIYGPASRSAALLVPGLYRALFERADQVLIDEARVPVLIGPADTGEADPELLAAVYEAAGALRDGEDFTIDASVARPVLAAGALARVVERLPWLLDPHDDMEVARALVTNALHARHVLRAGDHYQRQADRIVVPGLLPGQGVMSARDLALVRRFIECRETPARLSVEDVVARITCLDLFRRYHCLAGAASSLDGIAGELRTLYGARVQRPVSRRPPRAAVRCAAFDTLGAAVAFVASRTPPAGGCAVVLVDSPAQRDAVVQTLGAAGAHAAADLDAPGKRAVAVYPLRDFLPLGADALRWRRFERVDVFALAMPVSRRQLDECRMAAAGGASRGLYWQLMLSGAPGAVVPGAIPGRLAMARSMRWLLRMAFRRRLEESERLEAAARSATLDHQAAIDDLFAFSGRGG